MLVKKEARRIRKLYYYFVLILLLTGCVPNLTEVRIQNETDADINKAETVFENDKRLTGAIAIFNDKEIIAGVTVKTFSRFNKRKIEKELTKKIEKHYKDYEVTVSADNKIIYETKKLMDSDDKEKLSEKIKELKLLSEEET